MDKRSAGSRIRAALVPNGWVGSREQGRCLVAAAGLGESEKNAAQDVTTAGRGASFNDIRQDEATMDTQVFAATARLGQCAAQAHILIV